jgi:hypothetical protein
MEKHDWMIKFDIDYKETYDAIFDQGYDEGIRYAVELGELNEWGMERPLLDFIQDDDLPLFVNFAWNDSDVQEDFNERLKTLDKKGVEKKRKKLKREKTHA